MKFPGACPPPCRKGFTLVEMLVVIVIIIVLATLSSSVYMRVKLSASKVKGINQLRNISAAVVGYSTEKGLPDFFYYTNGTSDDYDESGDGSKFNPGNPAQALYNVQDPASGYIQDFTVFFSPLVKFDAPKVSDYDPSKSSKQKPWGTYAWYYPYAKEENLTGTQRDHVKDPIGTTVNPSIEGRYMMSESYPAAGPKYGKFIYHALMSDGSVQFIADSTDLYKKWLSGQ